MATRSSSALPRGPCPGEPTLSKELGAVTRLAAPIAAAHFGQVLLGFVDTAVVGRLGPSDLGALGVGNSIFFGFGMFGSGIVMGIDPLIAQSLGAERVREARRTLWQGVWLALAVAVPMMLLSMGSTWLLEPCGVEAVTAAKARGYILARAPAMLPYFTVTALASYLQSVGKTRALVLASIATNVVNLPLDWLLVLGDGGLARLGIGAVGLPALGATGAGIVSVVATLAGLAVVARATSRVGYQGPVGRRPSRQALGQALSVGLPVGLQRLAEVGVFSAVGLLMAGLGTVAVASHQVAMSFAAASFMVPLGISAAAAVRVGRFVGARERDGAKRSGIASFVAGGGFMAGCGLLFLLFPHELAAVLTDEPEVIAAAVPLLRVGALFQISDGMQVVGAGALRGMGDTRAALYLNLIGHYVVGMPVGMALTFAAGWGATGLWWGLCAGLTAVAVALSLRFARLASRGVEPLAA